MKSVMVLALALMVPGVAHAAKGDDVAAAVADAGRPDADKARDAARKPAAMVSFAGVKAGAKVGELLPGAGYFTRVIAKTVGDKGTVYIWMPASAPADRLARLDPLLKSYANVKLVVGEQIAAPEKLDVIWTTQNYHDLHHGGRNAEATNTAAFAALKPGGLYLVSDHAARKGSGVEDTDTLHRIDAELV